MKTKWLVIALIASATANLGLVGFWVGMQSGPSPWAARGFDPTVGLGRLLRFLPEERRDDVLGNDKRREIRASLRDMRRAQRAIDRALAAEPFPPDELEAALRRFAENQARMHAAFVDVAAALTPDERRRFRQTMRRGKRDRARGEPDGRRPLP